MLIGLTGLIGAGKSTAAGFLAERGACVIDADQIGKEIVDTNEHLRRELADEFGGHILRPDRTVDRAALAAEAFYDDESRRRLNAIVHPHLLLQIEDRIEDARQTYSVIVIDAALLLEWNLDTIVDLAVLVYAKQSVRIERLLKRGMNRRDIFARQRQQLSEKEARKRCQYAMPNNGTSEQLRARVFQFWDRTILSKG